MTKLTVSLACTQTDRAAPILDGRIAIEGCEVLPLPGNTQEIFKRVLDDKAFDIAEMSFSTHIVQVARGVQDYVAIPIFLSRTFRHSAIYIRTDRGIQRPEDLAGRTVGVEQYQQTVGLWVRGIIGDEHGVKTQDVNWRNGGLEQPGGGERLALKLPDTIKLSAIGPTQTLNAMLADGELDAMIASRPPSCFEKGAPGVARMFPEYKAAEMKYFERTRCFPIMHCVVIRRSLVDQHPWLPAEVYKAFVKAKAYALSEMRLINIMRVSLPWLVEHEAETRKLMGKNMWSYGLKDTRHEVETLVRYSHNDGLIDRLVTPEEIFHPSTHGLADQA